MFFYRKITNFKSNSIIGSLKSRERLRGNVFILISTLIIFGLIVYGKMPQNVDVKLGQPAPRDIRAPRDIVDEVSTKKIKLEAMEAVETLYNLDTSIQIQVKADVRMYFKLLRELQNDEEKSNEEKIKELEEQNYVRMDSNKHTILLATSQEENMLLEDSIYEVINQVMNPGVTKGELDSSKERVSSIFDSIEGLSPEIKDLGVSIVNSEITVNKFPDVKRTEQEKEKVADSVNPVVIKEGEIIVSENSNIDRAIYALLEKAGLISNDVRVYIKLVLGSLLLTIVLEVTLGLFIKKFDKDTYDDFKKRIVILAIIVLTLMISRGVSGVSGYLMPLATVSILVSIISNERVALIVTALTSILLGVAASIEMSVFFMLLVSGIVGSFACRNIQQRSNVIIIGLIISLSNMLIILGYGLIDDLEMNILLTRLGYGLINGILCSIIAIGTLPIWENYFGVLTPIKLLEIMSPNNPLLKRLLLEAPGTYYHSILVGNLAERAAGAIGANSLLVRVASYYHDVGKLRRPYFFKENQTDMENPHDSISPSLSKTIITSHTADGVSLAKKHGIPKEITDIMVEHHGTTLASFFYYEAKKEDPEVNEEDFRYKGIKPQSKEAGIIMIADSVEAATRSLKSPTEEKLLELIKNIIKSKLDDGQLDESGLTIKDLKLIEISFVDTISGIYHDRIAYPNIG